MINGPTSMVIFQFFNIFTLTRLQKKLKNIDTDKYILQTNIKIMTKPVNLQVSYKQKVGEEICYKYPDICATFKSGNTEIVFLPESLKSTEEWNMFMTAIEKNLHSHIILSGTNSYYELEYDDNMFSVSLQSSGSGCVGGVCTTIPFTPEIKETLERLEKLAKCIEDNIFFD